jgi:regulation of enolase protein 1 (concanavalin A-like superfamily)
MIRIHHVLIVAVTAGVLPSGSLGAGVIYRDDFSESTLQAGWMIIRPDPSTYSLTSAPGFFRVLTVRGLLGEEGTAKNLLVRPVSGDFILDSRVEFDPRDGQPFAGLLVYQDDAHAVSIGLAFASGDRGAFRGVVMLNVGDNIDATNHPASKYDETNVSQPGVIHLRLLRQGDQFIGAYSDDGIAYREIGTVTNPLNAELSVGVGAANGDSEACGPACDVPIPAKFDSFQISTLGGDGGGPPVPGALESVDIEGPTEVVSSGSGTFHATAHFNDGTSDDVSDVAEWVVAPPEAGTIEGGIFIAASTNAERMATVVVTYTQENDTGSIARTNATLVRIKPNESAGRLCGAGIVGLLPFAIFPLAWRGHRGRGTRSYF